MIKLLKKYGQIVDYVSNSSLGFMVVEFLHHFQAVDAVKGINYYFSGNKDTAKLRIQEQEMTYPVFCLLRPNEIQIWQDKDKDKDKDKEMTTQASVSYGEINHYLITAMP